MERRELLYGSAGALAIAVAGCTGQATEGDDDGDYDDDDDGDDYDDDGDDYDDDDSEADYDGEPEGISGFDAGGFSVGDGALTVDWMTTDDGVLDVTAVIDTTREDLLDDVPVSAEGLRMLAETDPESLTAEDAESFSDEEIEAMFDALEPMLMDLVEDVPMDAVESIDDIERFGQDIHQIRFQLCDHTSTELLSFTIDVAWMRAVADDLMEDEEFVAEVRETVEYLVEDDELVARVLATLEHNE